MKYASSCFEKNIIEHLLVFITHVTNLGCEKVTLHYSLRFRLIFFILRYLYFTY